MLSLGLPMIFVWVFGTIIFAFWFLLKYRKHLEVIYVKRYFLILYQGLRPETFYWEFVNTGKKVFIIICNVILTNYNPMYRVLISVLIILQYSKLSSPSVNLIKSWYSEFRNYFESYTEIILKLHFSWYKDLINNQIEIKAIMIVSFTLYWRDNLCIRFSYFKDLKFSN